MRAPAIVRQPATVHAASRPGIEGTAPVISDGWTKIEAPMMVPTTIAVACGDSNEPSQFNGVDASLDVIDNDVGVIDSQRARQLTDQLLRGIRTNRAKVVVIDITGVAAMDATVANHLVQTVEASRLLGATVIVTGLSPEIAQTIVNIGVDLGKMNTVGDLQGGIEQAERLLGYKVVPLEEASS